jgi:hypothetical protein
LAEDEFAAVAMTHPTRTVLLTTRLRAAIAVTLTAFFVVRDVAYPSPSRTGWLLPIEGITHGRLLVATNLAFYGYLCWIGFCFIRGTVGAERLFMVGWFISILLWPLKVIRPLWMSTIMHIGGLGSAVALFAALQLLLHPPYVAADDGSSRT